MAIKAEAQAEELGRKVAKMTGGRFFATEAAGLGAVVLQDYELQARNL